MSAVLPVTSILVDPLPLSYNLSATNFVKETGSNEVLPETEGRSVSQLVQTAENSPQALAQASGDTKTAKPKHFIALTSLLAK
jgi:hypothetical protein